MPDYKEMYRILFHEISKVISMLQKIQQKTEEMYMAEDLSDNLIIISPNTKIDREDEEKQPPQG